MAGLAVATLQTDCFVFSACSGSFTAQQEQLAVALHTSVQLWQADAEGQQELVTTIPFNDTLQSVLAVSNFTGLDWLVVLTLEQKCILLEWDVGSQAWTVSTTILSVIKASAPRRVDQLQCSSSVHHKEQNAHYVQWALAALEGVIHVLRVTLREGRPDSFAARAYWTGSRHPEATMAQIEMISTMHSWDVVAVVLATGSPAGTKLDLHSYEINNEMPVLENMSTKLSVAAGPWLLRNVHPTSYLLFRCNARHCGVAGFVLISSISITVLNPDWVDKHHSYYAQLAGLPTCVTELPGGRWLVGDSMGKLYVLHGQDWSIREVTVELHGPVVSPPSVLCHLASWGGQPGMLFLGSQSANSQLLLLDPRLLAPESATADDKVADGKDAQPHDLQMHDPAFVDSPAPVHSSLLLQDPPGCGEQRLLMACGVAPAGSLRLASMSLSLAPTIQGGPVIEGQPSMHAVQACWGDRHHASLAFSSTSTDSTLLMDVSGTHFQQLHLPGLITRQATILLAGTAQGVLVQVTAEAVRLISPVADPGSQHDQPLAEWLSTGGPCSTAALHENSIAVGLVTAVQLLQVQAQGRGLREQQLLQFAHQVSAVALFQQHQAAAGLCLAVGLWEANEVQLVALPEATHLHTIPLVSGHARSIVTGTLGSSLMLFAGCSDGSVIYCKLRATSVGGNSSPAESSAGAEAWPAGAQRVHAGSSGVALYWVPAREGSPAHVYAQSDKGLVLRAAASSDASASQGSQIDAVRVHGAEGLVAVTPVHTEEMPAAMAWLSPDHTLTFGQLDHRKQLHWHTHTVGDMPEHLAYHVESGCCVCLSKDAAGMHWLRLYQAATLREVASVQLGDSHVHTALTLAALPCSSACMAAARGRKPHPKRFLVVASYLEDGSTGMERLQGLLSFFEICSGSSGIQLLHHGTRPIPAVCHCLTAAEDPADEADGPLAFQLLLAGCHDAVRLYRVQIDDASERSNQAVAAAIERVAAGESLQVTLDGLAGNVKAADAQRQQLAEGEPRTAANFPETSGGDADEEHLGMQLLQEVPGSRGTCITEIAACAGTVLVAEFLTSLTAFRLAKGPPWLYPVSADSGAVHVQALHMLSPSSFLVGLHPRGLQLVQRDSLSEEAAFERWQHHVTNASASGVPLAAEHAGASTPDMQALHTQASCSPLFGISAFCTGALGVRSFLASEVAHAETAAPGKRESALFVANNGIVGVVGTLADHELGALAPLSDSIAASASGRDLAGFEHWAMACRPSASLMSTEEGLLDGAAPSGQCVDLNFLQVGQQQQVNQQEGSGGTWVLNSLRQELLR